MLGGVEHYPVYVRIAYSKNNTKFFFPLLYKASYITESEYQQFFIDRESSIISKQIDAFEKEITDIMRFEIKVLGDKFSFKNLSKKRTAYHYNLSREFEKHLCDQLVNEVHQETKKEDVKAIHSEYLSFWDTFQLLIQLAPNLLSIISDELHLKIKSFIGLKITNFDGVIDDQLGLRIIDWLNEKVPLRYKDSILGFESFENYFKGESPNSPVWKVLSKITLEKKDISKYLIAIEKVITQISS